MNNEAKLTQGEIDKAWEDAFEEPVEFDHKPTAEEVFNYRLKVVADKASEKAYNQALREVRDGKASNNNS